MHELAEGSTRPLKYEDIVVQAFEMFPDEFALRGHPKYPDSSDVHKPLYGALKRRGLIRAAQKTFALTPKGVETAARLMKRAGTKLDEIRPAERMTRDMVAEVERMTSSAAFEFHATSQDEKILDTDFYNFLGCTVRTPTNDFLGRLNATADAVAATVRLKHPDPETARLLAATLSVLRKRFAAQIKRRQRRG